MSINAKAFKSDECNDFIAFYFLNKNSVSVLRIWKKNKQIDYKQWKLLTRKKE
jgi:hypothetical protein